MKQLHYTVNVIIHDDFDDEKAHAAIDQQLRDKGWQIALFPTKATTTIRDTLERIDWKLLREQKEYCLNEAGNNAECEDIYDGITHLIDSIQDSAVADGLATEAEVFGEPEPTYYSWMDARHAASEASLEHGFAYVISAGKYHSDGPYKIFACKSAEEAPERFALEYKDGKEQ